jgi:transcriptional regulator with XRE-family HTH domain
MKLEDIGKNIEAIRKARGWSINYAANKALLTWSHLKKIESGQCNSTLKIIFRIANKWQVPIIAFFKCPLKTK